MALTNRNTPAITIRRAETGADFDDVRALCRAFVDWQLKAFPERREKILAYFEPEAYSRTLAQLPQVHARPKGAVLLAEIDGDPAGCVMYQELEPGIAEVKRLFVMQAGRGRGVGRALMAEMLEGMRADGYQAVRLDSAKFLTDARRLYDKLGFVERDPPADAPGHVYFMERKL